MTHEYKLHRSKKHGLVKKQWTEADVCKFCHNSLNIYSLYMYFENVNRCLKSECHDSREQAMWLEHKWIPILKQQDLNIDRKQKVFLDISQYSHPDVQGIWEWDLWSMHKIANIDCTYGNGTEQSQGIVKRGTWRWWEVYGLHLLRIKLQVGQIEMTVVMIGAK